MADIKPVAHALHFVGDSRICLSTIFDTRKEAEEYAAYCSSSPVLVDLYELTPEQVAALGEVEAPKDEASGAKWDKFFADYTNTLAQHHPALLVRQLAQRLEKSRAEVEALRSELEEWRFTNGVDELRRENEALREALWKIVYLRPDIEHPPLHSEAEGIRIFARAALERSKA